MVQHHLYISGMVSHQSGKLSKWQVIKAASHQSGKSSKQQVVKVASQQSGKSSKWQVIKAASHQSGKSSKWQVIKVASHQSGKSSKREVIKVGSHQSRKSSKRQVIKAASHQNGISSNAFRGGKSLNLHELTLLIKKMSSYLGLMTWHLMTCSRKWQLMFDDTELQWQAAPMTCCFDDMPL